MTEVPPRIIVLTAPSAAGKTTIARRVLEAFPGMAFSVSVTTRPPRPGEQDGRDYHFVSREAFERMRAAGELLEYEEVYPGLFYGTPRSAVEAAARTHPVLLDIDVKGALNVKRLFGDRALALFIAPPSLDTLEERLRRRGTETEASLRARLDRAREEMAYRDRFDAVIVNDDLERAVAEAIEQVGAFLHSTASS
ncbi:MAG: guanylate kinase [Bacteroidetes bacterium]|nr:guanylate kinase [Rhodothermaceae bacterium RA]RMH56885.1 MAG: guanylate kinase [Bacteroidota bacterium]